MPDKKYKSSIDYLTDARDLLVSSAFGPLATGYTIATQQDTPRGKSLKEAGRKLSSGEYLAEAAALMGPLGTAQLMRATPYAESKGVRLARSGGRNLLKSATADYIDIDPELKPEGTAENLMGFTGSAAGTLAPYGAGLKALKAAGMGTKFLKGAGLASRVGKGAALGGLVDLLRKPEDMSTKESLTTSKGLLERAKSMATGAATFGAFEGVFGALGKGISAGKKALSKTSVPEGLSEVSGAALAKRQTGLDRALRILNKAAEKRGGKPLSRKSALRVLEAEGAAPLGELSKQPGLTDALISPTERYASLDKEFGLKLEETIRNTSSLSNELKAKGSSIASDTIAPLKAEAKRLGLTGKDLMKMGRGEIPTPPEARAIVDGIRNLGDDTLLGIKQEMGFSVPQKQNYLFQQRRPKLSVSKKAPTIGFKQKTTTDPKASFTFSAKEASSKNKEALLIDDIWENIDSHLSETIHSATINPQTVNEVKKSLAVLQLNNQSDRAKDVAEWYSSVSGYGKGKQSTALLEDLVGKDQLIDIQKLTTAIAEHNNMPARRVYNQVSKNMFGAWVGLNPSSNIKQQLQPWLVSSVEVGPRWITWSKKQKMLGPKAEQTYKDALKAWDDIVRAKARPPHAVDVLEGAGGAKFTTAEQVSNTVADFELKLFTGKLGDLKNVKDTFIAGYGKTRYEGITNEVLEGLLESQQASVVNAAKKSIQDAAIEHGLIRTLRSNYIYNKIDRPELLRGVIGDLVPFTTWSRNQAMRFYSDISSGISSYKAGDSLKAMTSVKKLAERIAYPAVALQMLMHLVPADEQGNKFYLPSAHPAQSMARLGKLGIAPAITGPLEELFQGDIQGAAKDISSITPMGRAMQKYEAAEKWGVPSGIFGLRKRKNLSDILK
jgi:hypothetical protein